MKQWISAILAIMLWGVLPAQAQNDMISGTVRAAHTRQPLAGAVVMAKGSGHQTLTGAQGTFTLAIADSTATLVVSHAGYHTAEFGLPANRSADLELLLEPDALLLDNVTVNTGYQQLPRERATGSFDKVDNALFNRVVAPDVLSRLEGITPSLLFDKRTGPAKLTIRGLSTLLANSEPLVVLDNFPYEGDIRQINPNDVESVTLLKDAAAASIWGARAGNGVIVITTKSGRYEQPLRLSVTSNLTVAQKPDLYYQPQMSSAEFIEVEQFLFDKGYYNAAINNTSTRPVLSPVVEILQLQRSGRLAPDKAAEQIAALRRQDVRADFLKYLYQPALHQQHALSLSGGSRQAAYLLSVGYDRNRHTLVGASSQRLTLRTENTFRPLPGLELQAGLMLTHTGEERNSPGPFGGINTGGGKSTLYPYARLADAEGNPLPIERDYRGAYTDTAGGGRLLDWKYRPLEELNHLDNTRTVQDILLKAGIRYQLTNALSAELRYQYQSGQTTERDYNSLQTYFTRNLVNRYTQIAGATTRYNLPLGGILDRGESGLAAHSLRGQLNFQQSWQRHQLSVIAGAETRQTTTTSQRTRTYGYDDDMLTFANADFLNLYPIYGNLSSPMAIPNNTGFGSTCNRFVSFYANGGYTFWGRYTVSASARKDASNLFGVRTNQKWTPLWSTGLGWVLSEESFYRSGLLPHLKLRATYGFSGNTDLATSSYTVITYAPPTSFNNLPYASVSNPPNPALRWEKVGMTNVGVDFASRGDRVRGTIEYFIKHSVDLLSLTPVDPTTGFTSLKVNSAHLKGRGLDIQLHTQNIRGKLDWNTAWLFSYNKSRVSRYLRERSNASAYVGSGLSINPVEGSLVHSLYSYRWAGLDSAGNPQGLLNDKVSTDYNGIRNSSVENLVLHGSSVPLAYGAVRNTVSWKNISLSANITYQLGFYFRRSMLSYNGLFSFWDSHSDYALRWKQPGDEQRTTVPSLVYPANARRDEFYAGSEVSVERGDHIRLQDIRLSYDLNAPQGKRMPFRNIQLYLYASNLGILWQAAHSRRDPQYGSAIPPAKSLSLGITARF